MPSQKTVVKKLRRSIKATAISSLLCISPVGIVFPYFVLLEKYDVPFIRPYLEDTAERFTVACYILGACFFWLAIAAIVWATLTVYIVRTAFFAITYLRGRWHQS
jgi:hypothetical protein